MSFPSDEDLADIFSLDDLLPNISTESVAEALNGFSIPLIATKDFEWLATAIRRSLAITIREERNGPDRPSNVEIRSDLQRLATMSESTWLELTRCSGAAEARLWDYAWHTWDGDGGTDVGEGIIIGPPSDTKRFENAVRELEWLASFMRMAAGATHVPRGPWRDVERKRLRQERAQYLAVIFEAAFARKVSSNNFPHDSRHAAPTPFMEFYRRIITLAFDAHETSNLPDVVKAACREHRVFPAQFGEGIIPGL